MGIGVTIGLSTMAVVLVGTLLGATLPLIMKLVRTDPATSSAPFVATLCDICGLILYFLIALVAHTAGQVFLKHAMANSHTDAGFRARACLIPFAIGIALMTTQFFLNLGLLQRYDLSFIYPFQGLGVIMTSFWPASIAVLMR